MHVFLTGASGYIGSVVGSRAAIPLPACHRVAAGGGGAPRRPSRPDVIADIEHGSFFKKE